MTNDKQVGSFNVGISALPDIQWQPNTMTDCNRTNKLFERTLEEDLAYLHKLQRIDYHRRIKEQILELEQKNGIHRTYPDQSITYWYNQFTC